MRRCREVHLRYRRNVAASDWLYGDGFDAKLQDFKDKLKSLKALIDPILKRKEEGSGREAAIRTLKDGLENMSSMIKMIEGSIERAAQDAVASASSAASFVAESVTSSMAAASSADGDDLEEDPYSTPSTIGSTEATEVPIPKPYEYTQEDLSSMTSMYDSVQSWFQEKLALQEKLSAYDDPALLVSDLELRAQQLQAAVSDVIMKTIKMQELPKRPKKSSAKKSKTKKSKGGSSSTSEGAGSTTVSMKPTSRKDEL